MWITNSNFRTRFFFFCARLFVLITYLSLQTFNLSFTGILAQMEAIHRIYYRLQTQQTTRKWILLILRSIIKWNILHAVLVRCIQGVGQFLAVWGKVCVDMDISQLTVLFFCRFTNENIIRGEKIPTSRKKRQKIKKKKRTKKKKKKLEKVKFINRLLVWLKRVLHSITEKWYRKKNCTKYVTYCILYKPFESSKNHISNISNYSYSTNSRNRRRKEKNKT